MSAVSVEILSRPGCHLCDEAKDVIQRVQRRVSFALCVTNIETNPELERQYGDQIPVVFINGRKAFKYRVNESEFERKVRNCG